MLSVMDKYIELNKEVLYMRKGTSLILASNRILVLFIQE